MAISHCYWHVVVMNGYFTMVLISSGHKLAIFTVLLTSSSQEWQFHIATDWLLVVKNGNFSLLLTSHDKEWQLHIATDIATEVSTMMAHIFLVYYVILLLKLILAGHVCRWSAELSQIHPYNLSDEVTKIRCEMKYPDRLSDIHPPWTCQMKWQRSHVRWSTQIGCQIYHPVVTSHSQD